MIDQAAYGFFANSLALLRRRRPVTPSDVVSLGLAWLAAWLSKRAPSSRYTYGLRSSSILAALANAVLLALVTGAIAWEAGAAADAAAASGSERHRRWPWP